MSDVYESQDVIIVGSGLAGLTAALKLAQAGRQVTILEKATAVGGRAMSQQKAGFTFNLGPHAIYRGGEAFAYFQSQGFTLDGGLPTQKGSLALLGDDTFLLPGDPASFLKSKLLSGREKLQTMRALSRLTLDRPADYANITINDYLAAIAPKGSTRLLLETLSRITTYANNPEQASAEILILQYQHFAKKNVLYLDNGWQSLLTNFETRLQAYDVEIRLRQKVTALSELENGVDIELATGAHIHATSVVVATAPELTRELLPDVLLDTSGHPVEVAIMDVALKGLHDNRFYFASGLDKPYYYSVHSAAAELAPAGNTLIHIAKYLAPTGPDAKATEAEFEQLLDRLNPGWQEKLVHKRFLPHIRAVNRLATAANTGLAGRQPVAIDGLSRTFLAGDWIGSEGWLVDASIASALEAAANVLKYAPIELRMPV